MKIGSGIQKLIREYTHTDSKVISEAYVYFLKLRKAG
jgi:hypothetical protein